MVELIGEAEPVQGHQIQQAGDFGGLFRAAVAAVSPGVPSLISSDLTGRDRTERSASRGMTSVSQLQSGNSRRKSYLSGAERCQVLRAKVAHRFP